MSKFAAGDFLSRCLGMVTLAGLVITGSFYYPILCHFTVSKPKLPAAILAIQKMAKFELSYVICHLYPWFKVHTH